MSQQKQQQKKKEMKEHNPIPPPAPTLNSSPWLSPNARLQGLGGSAPAMAPSFCAYSGRLIQRPPPPVLTPLCAPNRNPAPWGPHSIFLLLPHPHTLPAGPSLCPGGSGAKNQNWSLQLLLRTPLKESLTAHSLCKAGAHRLGGAGWLVRLQGPSRISPRVPRPTLKTLKSQRGWLKVKLPHLWGQSCPRCPP